MAQAIAFDTLAYVKKLKAAGVPEEQAEVQAEALAQLVEERLATKQDINALELELKRDMALLKADIIKWFVGVAGAQAALIITLVKLV